MTNASAGGVSVGSEPSTLVESLQRAIAAHRTGQLDEAEEQYRSIIEAYPEESNAFNFLGVLLHQKGRARDGVKEIERSLELNPDNAAAHVNLGTVLSSLDEPRPAIRAYKRACELTPGDVVPFRNLGLIFIQYARFAEAVSAFQRVVELDPEAVDARKSLAECLHHCHRNEEAIEAVREWISRDPDNPVAAYLLAAYTQESVPERATDECMRAIFDECASYFDRRLTELEYMGPGHVGHALRVHIGKVHRTARILDAGCGTGLCAPMLRPYAAHLTGVDLSAGMLARAAERGLYDALHESELTAFLEQAEARFDIIVCADTLIYFGDLHRVMAGFVRRLEPGGLLVFTVEALEGRDEEGDVRLLGTGRYAHTLDHVMSALGEARLELASHSVAGLRLELGHETQGHIVVARRAR